MEPVAVACLGLVAFAYVVQWSALAAAGLTGRRVIRDVDAGRRRVAAQLQPIGRSIDRIGNNLRYARDGVERQRQRLAAAVDGTKDQLTLRGFDKVPLPARATRL